MRLLPWLGVTLALITWALFSAFIQPIFLPGPVAVFRAYWTLATQGDLWAHTGSTVWRTAAAFTGSSIAGLAVGIPLGRSRLANGLAEPLVDFFRSLPSPALIPISMLLFGLGDLARIAVALFTCTLINAVQAAFAVRSIPRRRVEAATILGADRWRLISGVLVPSMLPALVAGWRITLSLALIIIVVTEMFIGTHRGLGMIILDSHMLFRLPTMYAYVFQVGMLGYILNKSIDHATRRLVHWEGQSGGHS